MFEIIREDVKRLSPPGSRSLRALIAGLLSPGFGAILVYRIFNWCYRHRIPAQPFRYLVERFTEITTGISIPARCKIGKGLRIFHFGNIILHSTVEIGEGCTLYHEVTVGDRGGYGGAAKIGNDVIIGAGAKIIGEIEIGDRCIIGANAVITKSMPSDTVGYGNPAIYKSKADARDVC
jgi:serine O-acetyltransferase